MYIQEQAADNNNPEGSAAGKEPAEARSGVEQEGVRPDVYQGEAGRSGEGQGFNRVDVMGSLEKQVNQELNETHVPIRFVCHNCLHKDLFATFLASL